MKSLNQHTNYLDLRPNHEKVLYSKLLRFREEQLENYDGPPIMDYSTSDYHHNPPPQTIVRPPSTLGSLKASKEDQMQSQYSLLDQNRPPTSRRTTKKKQSLSINRRHSVAETASSYDPFNPSKAPITGDQADHARITVLRGASQTSSRKPSTRLGSRMSLRSQAISRAQGADELYSIASSPPNMTMHSSGTSQLQRLMVDRRISRGSSRLTMASRRSRTSNSSATVLRGHRSASWKRNVSFVQAARRPYSGRHPRLRSQEHKTSLTLQERYANDLAKATALAEEEISRNGKRLDLSSISLRETPEPEDMPIIRSKKAPVVDPYGAVSKRARPSSYFKDDARKVSTEIEKLCDEAFNRSSVASTNATPRTTFTGDSHHTSQDYSSQATSVSVREDLKSTASVSRDRVKEIKDYQHRPLPKPPATERVMGTEHLGSYTQRELAKTRDLLKKRAAESSMSPGYLDEIIAHLDRLMQPSAVRLSEAERRALSTPDSGIPRKDTFDSIMEKRDANYRAASEPYKKGQPSRKGATIRIVDEADGGKPISPVKPLSIRKKSNSSTPSSGSPSRPLSTQQIFTNEDLYRPKSERHYSAGLDHQELDPIDEDEDKENFDPEDRNGTGYLGQLNPPKKRSWFRRNQAQQSIDKQRPPVPPTKDHRRVESQNSDTQDRKRRSNAPSEESQTSEPTRSSGKGRFFKIFTSKRDSKDSQKSKGDYNLDDTESIDTTGSTRNYNPQQAYMSGALVNASTQSVFKHGKNGSRDDNLMPPPPVPRTIQPQHQNWLARFLRIKPAVHVMCFHVSKVRARKEVVNIFKDWRQFGMRDIVVDKAAGRVWARVDVKNCALLPFPLSPPPYAITYPLY